MYAGAILMGIGILDILFIGGMAFMMTMEAFGIGFTLAIIAALAAVVALVWAGLAPVVAVIIGGIALLTLIGLTIVLMIGAMMPKRHAITSWPANQEQAFMGYDSRMSRASGGAWLAGISAGAAFFFIALGIFLGVTPDSRDIGKTMNMSNITKKSTAEPPAPAPQQAPAPAPEKAPAEAPAPDKK